MRHWAWLASMSLVVTLAADMAGQEAPMQDAGTAAEQEQAEAGVGEAAELGDGGAAQVIEQTAAATPACAQDADCHGGAECWRGTCRGPDDHATAQPSTNTLGPKCRGQVACLKYGLCTARDGKCVAASDDDCRRSWQCRIGYCTARQGVCARSAEAACRTSSGCSDSGWCTARGNGCIAASDADCEQAYTCWNRGRCFAVGGTCVGPEPSSMAMVYASIALGVVGLAVAIVGGVAAGTATADSDSTAGAAVLVVGASMMLLASPLAIAGAWEVRPQSGEEAAVRVEPLIGPTGAALRVTF